MMSTLLNLLRLVLWCNIWSILENIPWALENNIYYAVWGWIVLHVSVRSSWLIAFFNPSILIFYPLLKVAYWSFQLLLLNCLFLPSIRSTFASCIFGALLLGPYMGIICVIFLMDFINMKCPSLYLVNIFCLKSISLSDISIDILVLHSCCLYGISLFIF